MTYLLDDNTVDLVNFDGYNGNRVINIYINAKLFLTLTKERVYY